MAFAATIPIELGAAFAGGTTLANLRARLLDAAGAELAQVTAGFTEQGLRGSFRWSYSGFSDGAQTTVEFYVGAVSAANFQTQTVVYPDPVDDTATGSGDTPVTAATLDSAGDNMIVRTPGGVGIDDVTVRAYVDSEWLANPGTAAVRAETRTIADGTWQSALMLDAGVEYTIVFAKSGYTFESTQVTP